MESCVNLLSCALVVVDDIEVIGGFMKTIFDCQSYTLLHHPCKHAVLVTSTESTIIFIQRHGCDDTLLASFDRIAVTQIFVNTNDPHKVQMRVTQCGGLYILTHLSIFKNIYIRPSD